ncbi:hypothetical protein KP2612_002455 [Komagataella phaffii]|uniref:Protein FMP42 n=1 Tax=Komagataella phaffii (strain GS115 / ATCC 20864) TaxID=644223 RepID=C4R0Y6_KOMPG|nr:uncharacterized protein PAS_chr2-1_0526 [Komagataella phaffii GS115]AOA62980.1 GQ67_00578T0 [Komagataella phaffii]AOA67002.1 GQ68_00810T0 [Komagataella phaffii GS115]CAH2448316.1 hypothetical protein BQ9382_C2-4120 [Komagataella phaffii CBS 7435]CAY69160.1 Putative protein of unknown function [Komagataella phaffii GS115]
MFYFQVPRNKRLAQVSCAILWCLFSGGPIFGFAALKPVLVQQHIYEDICPLTNSTTSLIDTIAQSSGSISVQQGKLGLAKCTEQDLKLNMMFTVGAVLTNLTALIIGRTLDSYGPRVCGLLGACFLFISCSIFIYSDSITLFDPYLFGYGFMALGGPFAYISSFQLSNAFPKKSGSVLALLTGAFDASSAVFLFYQLSFLKDPAFTIQNFFKLYLVVPTFITLAQIFVMEGDSYLTPPAAIMSGRSAPPPTETTTLLPVRQSVANELEAVGSKFQRKDSLGDAMKTAYAEEAEEEARKQTNSVFGILHGFPSQYQFRTYWFLLMCLFSTIQMLRLNYFVATVHSQYAYLFNSPELAEKLNSIFDIALPLGGVLSIPFVGLFLDHCPTIVVLTALLVVSLIIGVLGLVGSFPLGVLNVLIFAAYRPFFYTTISDYCAKVFGFETFGTVYGAIMTISGMFNFGQKFLDQATHTTFKMNPVPLNIILVLVTLVIGGITCLYVQVQGRIYNQKKHQHQDNATLT